MRTLLLSIALAPALFATAQQSAPQPVQPPAGSNWQHVHALPAGTSIHLNTAKRHLACNIQSVDAETLTCNRGKNAVFQRTEITSIKLTHRGRSTLVAAGIGAGVGAIVGAAAGGCTQQQNQGLFGCFVGRGGAAAGGGALFGAIGAPIGYFTDFTRSTVYKAP